MNRTARESEASSPRVREDDPRQLRPTAAAVIERGPQNQRKVRPSSGDYRRRAAGGTPDCPRSRERSKGASGEGYGETRRSSFRDLLGGGLHSPFLFAAESMALHIGVRAAWGECIRLAPAGSKPATIPPGRRRRMAPRSLPRTLEPIGNRRRPRRTSGPLDTPTGRRFDIFTRRGRLIPDETFHGGPVLNMAQKRNAVAVANRRFDQVS